MYGESVDFVDGEERLVVSSSVVDTYNTGVCFGAKDSIYIVVVFQLVIVEERNREIILDLHSK